MRAPFLRVSSCFLTVLLAGAFAQVPAPTAPYAQEPLVIEHSDMLYHMLADGTGFRVRTIAAHIQDESTLKQLSVLSVPFAANSEHVEWVYARVKHADGTVTTTAVADALEVAEPVTREAPFYSDLKQSQLPVRDLRVGDTLEWQAKVVGTRAEAPGQFWGTESFTRGAIVLSQTLKLELPREKSVNVWSPGLKPVESTTGDEHVFLWTTSRTKPTVGPEADAAKELESKRVHTPAEDLDDRLGKLPDVAWTTFKSWEEVGAWYRGLEADRMAPSPEIKAKVAQLTAGKTTDQQRLDAVYAYVSTQIHYIGVAFGVGRYQPHSAADVLQNQYGDCKDKHTLLAAMLNALGLQPDAVLIGAGIRFNAAVPSPAAFNHLITRVTVDGKPLWLDSTAEVAPPGMLLFVTRDEEALVIPGSGPARVERTPAQPPFESVATLDAKGTLDADGTSLSRITMTFRGDTEVVFRSVIRQVSPSQYDQVAQQICANMGYAGTASHMVSSRPEDTSKPFEISFDYKRVKAGDWATFRTIAQLAPSSIQRLDDKQPLTQPVNLGVPRVELSNASMKLPAGWGAELPEAVHERSPYAIYDETYRLEDGTIHSERRLQVLQQYVPVSDVKTYTRFAEKADLGNESYIQLTHPVSAGGKSPAVSKAANPAADPAANPAAKTEESSAGDAAALLQQAFPIMVDPSGDLNAAQALLDRTKALKPEQPGLWSGYGYLSFRRGDLAGSIVDYRKELTLHPAGTQVYPALIQAQLALHQQAEAKQTLGQWIAADPSAPQPSLQLAALEIRDSHPHEAIVTLQHARVALPDDGRIQLMLGKTEIESGDKEHGHQLLLALVKSTEDTGLMNDAAYELADAGFELPLAEATTRKALDQMEAQSLTWTLDENQQTLRRQTTLLQATWDTMGWIYFREGKLDLADQYVRASWLGRQSGEVGLHLGQISAARGEKNKALSSFELARATYPGYDDLGVRTPPGPQEIDLQARADALKKAGARSSTGDPRQALQKLRTIPIGAAAGLNGTAEYRLLVSQDAVVRADPTGTRQLTGGQQRLKLARLTGFSPAGSHAQLVFTGMLNCHSNTCELVLEP